jgi:peptidyl-dipeptidase A
MKGRSLTAMMIAAAFAAVVGSCGKDVEMDFGMFIEKHVETVAPLEREGSLAYWNAALSGSEEDFRKYSDIRLELERIYSDRAGFETVCDARDSGKLKDPSLVRMADVLYLRYLGNQADPRLLDRIVGLSAKVENRFNVFRAEVGGKRLTTNDVYGVLRESDDGEYRRAVWEASKAVGGEVAGDLLDLVRLRNQIAREAGFDNYHSMSLTLGEQDEETLAALFDELDELTAEPFRALKEEIDKNLAKRFGITADELRPWHYSDPFFQEAPSGEMAGLDGFFRGRDIVALAADFYESIGMPVGDVIAASDLYERDGKNPHAFCTDIDREGDIRVLCNVKDNVYWMETMLHELGHAAYDKYIQREIPWLLRSYPHLATTEAVAMYFGRLAQDPRWIAAALGLDEDETDALAPAVRSSLRARQLIFTRWTQVMFRFERELYRDPDGDLNTIWWDLVERYQFVRRPDGRDEPDWASKIHIVSNPVYYHNYMLGEMIASQLHHHILAEVVGDADGRGIYGDLAVGEYFRDKVFRPGNTVPWTKHIEMVTGEPLQAKYFVEQFAGPGVGRDEWRKKGQDAGLGPDRDEGPGKRRDAGGAD